MSGKLPTAGAALSGKHVLIVEDEFLIALDIQSIIESARAKAVAVNHVNDALKLVDGQEPFDVALLDLKLDRETSIPVAERLYEEGVPFVFLTGAPDDVGIAARFKQAPIVAKPFDRDTLLSALDKALAARR